MSLVQCVRPDEARQFVLKAKREGQRVGVVPTMGALHEGHLSLVRTCDAHCDTTVVTVFVNPTQFGPGEDFEQYPRPIEEDRRLLQELGASMLFTPDTHEMYRPEHSTSIEPPHVARRWEGEMRPGHFRGVVTVVLKLLQIIPADMAFFGQKDYQQVRVIQDMCLDLHVATAVRTCATVREPDGLAMSSRNAYLSEGDRERALGISRALRLAVTLQRDGVDSASEVQASMVQLLESSGVDKIDYVALVDPLSLEPVDQISRGTVVLIAAYVGSTRLIDNIQL